MSLNELQIGVDELPADGENCTRCKEVISGVKYCVYVQLGQPEAAKYAAVLCEKCYLREDE